jgi:hypothetical protein
MAVWSSLWYLLIFFPIWYVRAKITLATLKRMCSSFIFFLARSKKKSNAFFLIDLICRLSEHSAPESVDLDRDGVVSSEEVGGV